MKEYQNREPAKGSSKSSRRVNWPSPKRAAHHRLAKFGTKTWHSRSRCPCHPHFSGVRQTLVKQSDLGLDRQLINAARLEPLPPQSLASRVDWLRITSHCAVAIHASVISSSFHIHYIILTWLLIGRVSLQRTDKKRWVRFLFLAPRPGFPKNGRRCAVDVGRVRAVDLAWRIAKQYLWRFHPALSRGILRCHLDLVP